MARGDIDELCCAISDCFESIDDLILKIWFRRRFLRGNRRAPAHAYDQAVHGWQDPPFDVGRLRAYPKKRSRRARPLQDGRPEQPPALEGLANAAPDGERASVMGVPDALPGSRAKEPIGGASLSPLSGETRTERPYGASAERGRDGFFRP